MATICDCCCDAMDCRPRGRLARQTCEICRDRCAHPDGVLRYCVKNAVCSQLYCNNQTTSGRNENCKDHNIRVDSRRIPRVKCGHATCSIRIRDHKYCKLHRCSPGRGCDELCSRIHACKAFGCLESMRSEGPGCEYHSCQNHWCSNVNITIGMGCPQHTCKIIGCKNFIFDLSNDYCNDHSCNYPKCNVKIEELACADHMCKYDNCIRPKIVNANYCCEHLCRQPNCSRSTNLLTCNLHKCEFNGCNEMRETRRTNCLKHACGYEDCNTPTDDYYCIAHRCRHIECRDARQPININCLKHMCGSEDCNISTKHPYCFEHRCRLCLYPKLPEKIYCAFHRLFPV